MEELRDLRRRIRSIRGTQQITRAMSLVASTRLRRIERMVEPARTYAEDLRRVVLDIAARTPPWAHPLLKPRDVATPAYLVITSDRGLAGGYNAEIQRRATELLRTPDVGRRRAAGAASVAAPTPVAVAVAVAGRKGRDFFRRRGPAPFREYVHLPDSPDEDLAAKISEDLLAQYFEGRIDSLSLVFARFVSRGAYRPEVLQLLPIERPPERPGWGGGESAAADAEGRSQSQSQSQGRGQERRRGEDQGGREDVQRRKNQGGSATSDGDGDGGKDSDGDETGGNGAHPEDLDLPFGYEPSPESVLDRLFPHYLVSVVYAALVEAKASELAARTIAMDSATDNAGELIERLTLTYNRARQAEITQEISEIATGAESLR